MTRLDCIVAVSILPGEIGLITASVAYLRKSTARLHCMLLWAGGAIGGGYRLNEALWVLTSKKRSNDFEEDWSIHSRVDERCMRDLNGSHMTTLLGCSISNLGLPTQLTAETLAYPGVEAPRTPVWHSFRRLPID